ncbi:hypothetical protein Dpo_3c00210 [Desulfotignum phosphitoxidans DSM 13687]|uniref:Uncharacterized protein n=1 Tax=Desulfotignum phosphitoxidans DSM 13687 TaxID=1286635 RepID=S0G342_9BACT|nr:hypothetical protein Dpo_3c00210 [Desulfotignum phosphitoxidans DSM 13687]
MNKSLGGTASNSIPDSKRIKKYPFWESRLNIQPPTDPAVIILDEPIYPRKGIDPRRVYLQGSGWQSGQAWTKKQFIPIKGKCQYWHFPLMMIYPGALPR